MTSSTSKISSIEATKTQASTSNFMLSLLTACSSSVPVAGKDGEATLLDQLSGLLQDKAMAFEELNYTYAYRFGFSINDTLKFVGFDGKLNDFLDEQKGFVVHDGCISLKPTDSLVKEEQDEAELAAAWAELAAALDYSKRPDDEAVSIADTESTADAGSCIFDSRPSTPGLDDNIDISGWQSVGNRLVAALGSSGCEADIDSRPWKELGCLIAAALDSDDADAMPWKELGCRIATDPDSGDADAMPWRELGCRIAAALDSDDDNAMAWRELGCRVAAALDSDDADAMPWRELGCRVAAALDSDNVDAMPCKELRYGVAAEFDFDDEDALDVAAWQDVGSRLAAACKRSSESEDSESEADADEWSSVGVRVFRSLQSLSDDDL